MWVPDGAREMRRIQGAAERYAVKAGGPEDLEGKSQTTAVVEAWKGFQEDHGGVALRRLPRHDAR